MRRRRENLNPQTTITIYLHQTSGYLGINESDEGFQHVRRFYFLPCSTLLHIAPHCLKNKNYHAF